MLALAAGELSEGQTAERLRERVGVE
jgi:hypothetical protein